MIKDTIAAIATAMTASGIGIIRISGEEAFVIVDRIYKGKKKEKRAAKKQKQKCVLLIFLKAEIINKLKFIMNK